MTFADYLKSERKDVDFNSQEFGCYASFLHENYVPNGYLIRKNIIDKIECFNIKALLEDWYLMLQISKISKLKYINQLLFSYRWHDRNSIKNNEKTSNYVKKTFLCEINTVSAGSNQKIKRELNIFLENLDNQNRKDKIKLGKLLEYYKVKKLFYIKISIF